MSDLHKQLIKNKLPIPGRSANPGMSGKPVVRRRDYSPTPWNNFFDRSRDITLPNGDVFRIYLKGSTGPLLFLIHGGGYSGLSWSLFTASIIDLVECQIAAFDVRGHGESRCIDDMDLSAETLSNDVGEVISKLFDGEEPPPVILVGHSMGGAIAVRALYKDLVPTAIGLIVIDVVEGTAIDALQSMQSFLRSRPSSFPSITNAIEWCVRSGQVRNVESAKVSMPSQLKNSVSNECAIRDIDLKEEENDLQTLTPRQVPANDSILEESEEENAEQPVQLASQNQEKQVFKCPKEVPNTSRYVWRIELSQTEKYWRGWFEGLSNMFLATSIPKLLLLAGVDRLDRDLTVGHMQGKFQMQVLPKCGHAVHEDDPDKVAEAIATFLVRNKFTNAVRDFPRGYAAC